MHLFHKTPFIYYALRALGWCFVAGALSGCATTYAVKVTALRSSEAAPCRTYRLVSAVEGRDAYDPRYPGVATLVERALAAHGLFAASRPEWADVEIRVDFSEGLWRLQSQPSSEDPAGAMVFIPQRDGAPISESTGAYVPASALRRVEPVREKSISLVARENAMGGLSGSVAGRELWRVEATIADGTSSLAEVLPVLVGALVPHIDRANEDCVERMSPSSPQVRLLAWGE